MEDSILKTNTTGETQQHDTHMESHVVKKTRKKGGGRKPANKVIYKDVDDHVEGIVISNGTSVTFKIDKDDLEKVQARHWYLTSGGKYVGSCMSVDGNAKVLMLHNLIMNRLEFPGKGASETVDHINRNGLDNRKNNLRVVSQTLQNVNQKKKERRADLPEGFEDLPRHIWYIKADAAHGDRFAVELKTEKLVKKTTSSKKVSLQDKFQEALRIREELYTLYPYLRQCD